MAAAKHTRIFVRKHVARRGNSFVASVCIAGRARSKSFALSTPDHVIDAWINASKSAAAASRVKQKLVNLPQPIPVCPIDELKGFCYIYFIACGDQVKIGRAMDPWARMEDMQVGSPQRLQLLAAIPSHASLEAALHRRFSHLRSGGEWFHFNTEVQSFIASMAIELNPIALLWNYVVVPAGAKKKGRRLRNEAMGEVMTTHEFIRRRKKERQLIKAQIPPTPSIELTPDDAEQLGKRTTPDRESA